MKKKRKVSRIFGIVMMILLILGVLLERFGPSGKSYQITDLPECSGEAYVKISDVEFTKKELKETGAVYGRLDAYKRCTGAFSYIGPEDLEYDERGDISDVEPSGWHSIKADDVDGGWLYNRCHLIANCLGGPCGREDESETELKRNLITGTRYLNIEGMEPFELMVRDYVQETGHHVRYKVVPVYEGSNLVASGVVMLAKSVEDKEIDFEVYCYNIQPGWEIDYSTGNAKAQVA